MANTEKKTVTIGGKEIPLTKNGLPNRVYLSKEARAVIKEYAEKKKLEKKEVLVKELTDLLNKLD
jgi:hypothetical protein